MLARRLCVKIKVKGTCVRIVLSSNMDHRSRQFLMWWLRVHASKLKLRVPVFVVLCRVSWIIEGGNFLCAGYASTRGYVSKLKLRVPVFVVLCRVSWIIERGNFLCAGYASTRQN